MESPRKIQHQISPRPIAEKQPLPYPIASQIFSCKNNHIGPTSALLSEHPISNPLFTLTDFFRSFQMKKRSKMTRLTLETDFFGSFQRFFCISGYGKKQYYILSPSGMPGHSLIEYPTAIIICYICIIKTEQAVRFRIGQRPLSTAFI